MNAHELDTTMKTNRIVTGIIVVLTGMVMLSVAANAQPGRGNKDKERKREEVGRQLNLTQDQKERIRASRQEFKRENATALGEIKALREQMKEQMKNKDREGAKSTREQIRAKMLALKPARDAMRQQLEQILTPEQRQQLANLREERKERMQDRRKEWREKHRGEGNGCGG
jgi:Spy/CpxP family protein refolding chaperone